MYHWRKVKALSEFYRRFKAPDEIPDKDGRVNSSFPEHQFGLYPMREVSAPALPRVHAVMMLTGSRGRMTQTFKVMSIV